MVCKKLTPLVNIGLVHAPTDPHGTLATMKGFLELGAKFDHLPVNGGVVHVNPTFCHEFLDVACAQRVRHIPAHPHEHDLWGKMGSLETDRHRRSGVDNLTVPLYRLSTT